MGTEKCSHNVVATIQPCRPYAYDVTNLKGALARGTKEVNPLVHVCALRICTACLCVYSLCQACKKMGNGPESLLSGGKITLILLDV